MEPQITRRFAIGAGLSTPGSARAVWLGRPLNLVAE